MQLFSNHFEACEKLLAAKVFGESGLPAELLSELALVRAILARFRRQPEVALEEARHALAWVPDDGNALRVSAILEIGLAHRWLGDDATARRILNELVAQGEMGENWTAPLIALEALRIMDAREGRLSRVEKTCEQAIQMVSRWNHFPPAAGMAYVGLGEVQCERNELDRAERNLQQGLRLLVGTLEDEPIIHGYFALARIAQARGDATEAHASLQRAEGWFRQVQIVRAWSMAHLEALHARLWIWQGDLPLAEHWAQDRNLPSEDLPENLSDIQENEVLTLARLRIAQGRSDPSSRASGEALTILEQLLPQAETTRRLGSMIEIQALRALAFHDQGHLQAALDSLEQALNLAEAEGYVRIFLDEGRPMHALLLKAGRLRGNRLQKPVQRVLLEFETSVAVPAVTGQAYPRPSILLEPLTPREMEILRLVADGASNRVIAEQLYLSTGTVKIHLKHIFGKLGVTSRTQAIARARELNLL
jgi:LuxR family maltose regulon positive regulatory protein